MRICALQLLWDLNSVIKEVIKSEAEITKLQLGENLKLNKRLFPTFSCDNP